jgi:regulation of enolase protein 1 (concanavalin A-like superfamily)
MTPKNLLIRLSLIVSCVSLIATARAALPAGWANLDVGTTGIAGSSSEASGTFTVAGGGATLWGTTSQLQYAYQTTTYSGDCWIQALVQSQTMTDGSNKAGVMMRTGTATTDTYVYGGFQTWYNAEAFSNNAGLGARHPAATVYAPYWIRLERTSGIVNAQVANDLGGGNHGPWVDMQAAAGPLALSGSVTMGLAVSSHQNATLSTAQFKYVTMGTGVVIPPPIAGSWTDLDIGTVGATGSMQLTAGVFTVKGAGLGMNTTDACNYASMPLSGNGTGNGSIVARITGQDATAPTTGKGVAGVMFRENTTATGGYIYMGRNSWGQVNCQYRRPGQWVEAPVPITGPALPFWVKLDRTGTTVTASYSTNGTSWTTYFTMSDLNLPIDITTGLLVTSGDNTLATATFDNVTTTGTNPLLAGWSSQDLGTVSPAGSSYQMVSNVYTVKGSGVGFSGNSDNGQFLYKSATGDNQIVTRVTSVSGATNTAAPAGLMMRDALTTASKNVLISVSADKILRFQSHVNAGDTTSTTVSVTNVALPYWIKLARVGNVITGYYSADGWNWQTAGSATVTLTSNAYVGLIASSKTAGQLNTAVFDHVSQGVVSDLPPATTPIMTDILSTTENPNAGLSLVEEINTATVAPVYQSAAGVSAVQTIAGRSARVMSPAGTVGDTAATIAYVIGANKNLVAGNAYILTVDYPEDVPRTIFVTNRGADLSKGWTTGKAGGDAKQQYTEPTLESLSYPLSGQWKTFKQYFHLMSRFQDITGARKDDPYNPLTTGWRPYGPANGFHVIITRLKRENDPRSEGAAVGWIRLWKVTNPSALYARINYPPPSLPRRSIFMREEMADLALQAPTTNPNDLAFANSADFYVHKMKMGKILGINTLGKDLLEFGYNQGFTSGDGNWYSEPDDATWTKIIAKAGDEGLSLMPYFEYTGSLGNFQNGLGYERRSKKLYHEIKITSGYSSNYDGVTWTANRNADITDPATLVDVKRLMDRTVGDFKTQARFVGVWFRTRSNCFPMSFADPAIARFNTATGNSATQTSLISSYEGNRTLYNQYVNWWFGKRKEFLVAIQNYLNTQHGQAEAQVVYTPWPGEAVIVPHPASEPFGYTGVIVEPAELTWWQTFINNLPVDWAKYHWGPRLYSDVVSGALYNYVLTEQPSILDPVNNPQFVESFHSTPYADPWNYTTTANVAMTYPMGRLFTLEDANLVNSFRCSSGLTIIKHYSLNEDHGPGYEPTPYGGQLGYSAAETERAGDCEMLQQARAVAQADPRNLGYMCASSYNTGFPEVVRRFNQAFLAVPAVTSVRVPTASNNVNVVVRQFTTAVGTYYYVVNTSMSASTATVTLPSSGTVTELVTKATLPSATLNLTLAPAELRSYRVGP